MRTTRTRTARSTVLLTLVTALWLVVVGEAGAFHYPWDQGHDTTDYPDPDEPGPCEDGFCECDTCNTDSTSSPVYTSTGDFVWSDVDVVLSGRPGIGISRTFNSFDPRTSLFGRGWSFTYDRTLVRTVKSGVDGQTEVDRVDYVLRFANGKRYRFETAEDGTIEPPPGLFSTLVPLSGGGVRREELDGSVEIYGLEGELLREIDRHGNALDFAYDAGSRLTGISDGAGRSLAFAYGAGGLVQSITDHAGRAWTYGHDAEGNLVTLTDPLGGVMRYDYGSFVPEGDRFTYSQLVRITDETGVVVTDVTYDGRRVAAYTEEADTFSYRYFPASNRTDKTDSTGSTWQYTYDDAGLISRIVDPRRNITAFERDENGLLTKLTDPLGDTDTFVHDELGRQVSATNAVGATTTTTYVGDTSWPQAMTSETGRTVRMTVDATGNVTELIDPEGFRRVTEYNASGDVTAGTDPVGNRTEYTYDARGQLTSMTDALGNVDSMARDDLGRVTSATDSRGNTYRADYDALDRMVRATDPEGNVTSYEYDAASRPTRVVNAAGASIEYEYDEHGRLSRQVDYDGGVTSYTYRSDNLVEQVTYPSGTVYSAQYLGNGLVSSERIGRLSTRYEYDANDRVTSVRNETGTVSYTYDAEGRVLSETVNGERVSYEYNLENEVVAMSTSAFDNAYEHDDRGLLTRMSGPFGEFDFAYDGAMRRTRLEYPNATAVGYGYDALNRMTDQEYAGTFSADYAYGYDSVGNLLSWTGDGAPKSYGYDDRDQLVSYVGGDGTESFAYDELGNRVENGQSYNEINELVEDAGFDYSYDDDGNLVSKVSKVDESRTAYTWNDRDQLVRRQVLDASGAQTKDIAYAYGPMGRLWRRVENGDAENYVYAGDDRILTKDASGGVTSSFHHGPSVDEPLVLDDGSKRFYHANYLGSVMAITNASSTDASYQYSPYGLASKMVNSPISNPYGFTGRVIEENGLYFYRSRFYDASVGRFLSRDPIGAFDDLNYYRYVRSNPLRYTDPSGEIVPLIAAAVARTAARAVATSYSRCLVGCAIPTAAIAALRGCGRLGVQSCAKSCLNPMNWFPAKKAATVSKSTLHTRGVKPSPGTRVRPEGVPKSWRAMPTYRKGKPTQGVELFNPKKPNESVRIMQGNPKSPHPNSQVPYARQRSSAGKFYDRDGRINSNPDDTHIPLDQFQFRQ